MTKQLLKIFILFLFVASPVLLFAQEPDSLYQNRVKFISQSLSVKTEEAKTVINILDAFRTKINQVLAEKGQDGATGNARVDALVEERNQQLSRVLKPAQFENFKKAITLSNQRPSF